MKTIALFVAFAAAGFGQQYKIAVIGMVHSHVWGHLNEMIKGNTPAVLVGISEPKQDLQAEARKMGAADSLFVTDYKKMLDEKKPGHRLGLRRKQPSPRDCRSLRAAQDSRHLRKASGVHL